MSKVINMKGETMPEALAPLTDIELAWNSLFLALDTLAAEAKKPGFAKMGYRDGHNRVWATSALIRDADRRFNFMRKAIERL